MKKSKNLMSLMILKQNIMDLMLILPILTLGAVFNTLAMGGIPTAPMHLLCANLIN